MKVALAFNSTEVDASGTCELFFFLLFLRNNISHVDRRGLNRRLAHVPITAVRHSLHLSVTSFLRIAGDEWKKSTNVVEFRKKSVNYVLYEKKKTCERGLNRSSISILI